MNTLFNLNFWPSAKNQTSQATVCEPLISPSELDAKIQTFKNLTYPLFEGFDDGSLQVIGRRIIQLPQSLCQIKIEYESGNRLRLSTKIPLNVPYLELSEKDKLEFNHFLVKQVEDSFNSLLTPNLTYCTSQPNQFNIKCLGYCLDDLSDTKEHFKKTLLDWDQTMNRLITNLPHWKVKDLTCFDFALPKRTPLVSVTRSTKDFFNIDQLCIDTFKLIPQLKQCRTALELRMSHLDSTLLTIVGEKSNKDELFFIGYLNNTNSFSSFEPNISEQNLIRQAMDNDASHLLPQSCRNKIKNNSDSFCNPEYRTETFALTYTSKDSQQIKKDYEQFVGSVKKMVPDFEYKQ